MKPAKIIGSEKRAAAKAASRSSDRQRLAKGEHPDVVQRENSIFPPGYFEQNRILNFASAIGK